MLLMVKVPQINYIFANIGRMIDFNVTRCKYVSMENSGLDESTEFMRFEKVLNS